MNHIRYVPANQHGYDWTNTSMSPGVIRDGIQAGRISSEYTHIAQLYCREEERKPIAVRTFEVTVDISLPTTVQTVILNIDADDYEELRSRDDFIIEEAIDKLPAHLNLFAETDKAVIVSVEEL
jgi:hypothetical protein